MKTTTDGAGLGLLQNPSLCGGPDLWGHDGAIAAYVTLALNSKDGKRQIVILVNSMTLNDQIGSKSSPTSPRTTFQDRRLWCLTSEPEALRP